VCEEDLTNVKACEGHTCTLVIRRSIKNGGLKPSLIFYGWCR